jgi:hypothetical protein
LYPLSWENVDSSCNKSVVFDVTAEGDQEGCENSGFVSEIVHIQEMCSVGSKLWPFSFIDM